MKSIILVSMILFMNSAVSAQSFDHQHALWTSILKQQVKTDRNPSITAVDYLSLKADPAALSRYLNQLSRVSIAEFQSWAREQQLAFLINAYNAFTIQLILEHYPVASIKDIGSLWTSAWQIPFVDLLGSKRSLDDIEHNLIRGDKGYHEPRIHFAVNCASVGCPALRPEAYTAEKLDQQLDKSTRLFISDRSRNRFESGTYYLSSIFKWYREDFEKGWKGINSIEDFLYGYSDSLGMSPDEKQKLKSGEIKIQFLEYDWRLNQHSYDHAEVDNERNRR